MNDAREGVIAELLRPLVTVRAWALFYAPDLDLTAFAETLRHATPKSECVVVDGDSPFAASSWQIACEQAERTDACLLVTSRAQPTRQLGDAVITLRRRYDLMAKAASSVVLAVRARSLDGLSDKLVEQFSATYGM